MLPGKSFQSHFRSDYLSNKREFMVNSCSNSFTSLNQLYQLPPIHSMCFEKNMGYFFVNDNDGLNSDYSWRKYYSDLAFKFSQLSYGHSIPCCDFVNTENCMPINKAYIEHDCGTTDFLNGSKEFLRNSTNDHIWRPFSPPCTDIDDSSFTEANNIEETNKNLTIIQQNSIKYQPISPGCKLDHSKSSVFMPVKKKNSPNINSSSVTYDSMRLHAFLRIKSGSKPYVCDHPKCLKCFARNEELTRHKRIHSGFKPHQCTVCEKSFGRKDHLSKHLKTHLQASEKKVYVCCVSGCGLRYTRSDALTRHRSTAHSISKSKQSTKT